MPFSDLGLSEKVLNAVETAGYTEPTPIQAEAIPHVLARRDVLGIAQTGTGKTAAFTLPMLTLLENGRARARMPRTLILEPTRELAAQVVELENDLLALELTALRVVANSADGKPHPASSVLKLKGSVLQQEVTELIVDIAGPLAVASFAEEGSDVPDWARVSAPEYLNYRKVSIYGGSNEVQRVIISGTILGL